jgi:hypothetical protein
MVRLTLFVEISECLTLQKIGRIGSAQLFLKLLYPLPQRLVLEFDEIFVLRFDVHCFDLALQLTL